MAATIADYLEKYFNREIVLVTTDFHRRKEGEITVKKGETLELIREGKTKKEYYERGWIVKYSDCCTYNEVCTLNGDHGMVGQSFFTKSGRYEKEHYKRLLRAYVKKDHDELAGRICVTIHSDYHISSFFEALIVILKESSPPLTATGIFALSKCCNAMDEIWKAFFAHVVTILNVISEKVILYTYPVALLHEFHWIIDKLFNDGVRRFYSEAEKYTDVLMTKVFPAFELVLQLAKHINAREICEKPWNDFWEDSIKSDALNSNSLSENSSFCLSTFVAKATEAYEKKDHDRFEKLLSAFVGLAENSDVLRANLNTEKKKYILNGLEKVLVLYESSSFNTDTAVKIKDLLSLDWHVYHRIYLEKKPAPLQRVESLAFAVSRPPTPALIHQTRFAQTTLPSYDWDNMEQLMCLGNGGQAVVWLVKPKTLTVNAAAKIFIDSETGQFDMAACMKETDSLLQFNNHPNIVHIYGVISCSLENVPVGILMEHCKDGTLHLAIFGDDSAHPPVEPMDYDTEWIVNWFSQASCALQFLHDQKVLHRDVKPSNMLLYEGKRKLKVSDFGMTKNLPQNLQDPHVGSPGLYFKYVIGTMGYVAPELWDFKKYNAKVDVYSLGVSLFETVTRTRAEKDLWRRGEKIGGSDEWWINDYMKKMLLENPDERPPMDKVFEKFRTEYDKCNATRH